MTVELDNDDVDALLQLLDFKEGGFLKLSDPKTPLTQPQLDLVVRLTKIQMKLADARKKQR